MKSDNAIRNGTSIFVGIIVAIAAFVRGALLLPLLLVACSIWGLYVLHHLRGSLPAVPKKKAKAPAAPSLWCRTLRMLLLALILVRQERDSGLLSLIRSLPGGRLKTAIAKLAAFAASLLVVLTVLYGVNLAYCSASFSLAP